MTPDLSVVIPVYNRGDIIRHTLESVRRASAGLTVETVVVDDGSDQPVAESLERIGHPPQVLVRQENQGLLMARLAGLRRVTGRNVLFLDSDDLVSEGKFRLQLEAMARHDAVVSYSDTARCVIGGDDASLRPVPDAPLADTAGVAEFCIRVQPAPHCPIFRTDWLRQAVEGAFFPPSPLYNCVAEIWYYHNASILPGRVVRVPGPHTIIGTHHGARLTDHWENLGVASLAVMEAFARHCPPGAATAEARRLVGEKAFQTWRRLPRGFSGEFTRRILGVWRRMPRGEAEALGGGRFAGVARLLGPVGAGRVFRLFQTVPYRSIRTMDDAEFHARLRGIPAP